MFTPEQRDAVRDCLLAWAGEDSEVASAELVGSLAAAAADVPKQHTAAVADRWSDIDLALQVDGRLDTVLERWTSRVYKELDPLHHWDLRSGSSLYRVFLLPGWLELDLSFTPAGTFEPAPSPLGLSWHHAWHAYVSLARGRLWQAEHWIGCVRTQIFAMSSARHGFPTSYAKGAHLLPPTVTDPLDATLVRSLDPDELRRALSAVISCLVTECRLTDPELADRLIPALTELA